MKNTTKTIAVVCTLFLIAALFVGAASAATGAREVNNSDTAFVYENIIFADKQQEQGYLNYFDKDGVYVTSIKSDVNGVFKLLDVYVQGNTGIWYYDTSKLITKPTTNPETVNIQYPKLSVDLRKGTDSLNEKSIIPGESGLKLVLDAPGVTGDMNAKVSVLITTPVGGKSYKVFTYDSPSKDLDSIPLTDAETTINLNTVPDEVQAGTYTIQAEFKTNNNDDALFNSDNVIPEQYKKSETISVTINSADKLTITTAKDSVIRSNPFVVTVSGKAKTNYDLIVETTGDPEGINFYPSQDGVNISSNQNATITTDASGKITVEFITTAKTEAKTYTIKVCDIQNSAIQNSATAKVKVEKGAVTITASGDGSYYLGNEIRLNGTNTDSSKVYLLATGPNLMDGDGLYIATVNVKTDNTWEYKWKTTAIGLDTGAYTIYATSTPVSKLELANSEYATVSVNLKQPFLSAIPSGTVVAKGDKIYIRGTAEGNPSTLNIFIFGPNFFKPYSVSVKDDGSYEKKIEIPSTMSSNQYFIVVQHPMYNGVFDAKLNTADANNQFFYIDGADGAQSSSFYVTGNNKLQGSNAANALTKMIDSFNIDDIYTKLTFTVAEPMIGVEKPGDQEVGSSFTISGTTNLAVDDQILVEVMSSSFAATDKTSTDVTSGVSQTTKVVAGEGIDNTWSVIVDTTNWKLDEYTIKVTGIEVEAATSTNFNLVKKSSSTPKPTATRATSTTTATATPATPGFGALVALAGLGSVAYLVLRRN